MNLKLRSNIALDKRRRACAETKRLLNTQLAGLWSLCDAYTPLYTNVSSVAWWLLRWVCSLAELEYFHASRNKYKVEWILAKLLLLLFGECKRVITEICPANYTVWQPPAAKGQGGAFLSINRRQLRQKQMLFILSNRISGDRQRTLTKLLACLLDYRQCANSN